MVIIKSIRYRNILSNGNDWVEFQLNSTSLTLFIGKNGGGKSTMIDALTFAFYGKPFRDVNKDLLINTINGKNCEVEAEFESGTNHYKVRRGIKPNVFEFFVNGVMVPKDAKVVDYQKHVDRALRMDLKSFRQITVLGSRTFTPFMRLKTDERRALIEDVLDLGVFTQMNKLNKANIDMTSEELKEVDDELKDIRAKLQLEKQKITLVRDNVEDSIDRVNRKIAALKAERQNAVEDEEAERTKLDAALPTLEGRDDARRKLQDLRTKLDRGWDKLRQIQKNLAFYTNNCECPTCTQTIDAAFKARIVATEEAELAKVDAGILKVEGWIETAVKEVQEYDERNRIVNELKTSLAVQTSNVRSLDTQIRNLEREERDLRNSNTDFGSLQEEIDKWQESYDIAASTKNTIAERLEYYKLAATVLKDNGIKAKMIKQYIPIINSLINKYLGIMGFSVAFELNETFTESIKSQHKDTFSYGSFSEGEKMRLDLAILFTWRDIAKLRNTNATNLLLMDEVLDASLDEDGSEDFLRIIQEMTSDTNTIIISHKSQHLMERFDRVVQFTKVKKFSNMKVLK